MARKFIYNLAVRSVQQYIGMGTTHAWESFGDGAAPDIQAVAKGLGGGYASIGAVLMSKEIANGIRDKSGFWAHGHTYQVISSVLLSP